MSTITLNKTYDDGSLLYEADLDNAIESIESYFNSASVDNTNINTGSITEVSIINNSVTTDLIADNSVTTVKILDDNVTTDKIGTNTLTYTAFADDSISQDKYSGNLAISDYPARNIESVTTADTGNVGIYPSGIFSVPSLNITCQTARPVLIFLQPSGAGDSYIRINETVDVFYHELILRVHESYFRLRFSDLEVGNGIQYIPIVGFSTIAYPGVGTHAITWNLYNAASGAAVRAFNLKLVAMEL